MKRKQNEAILNLIHRRSHKLGPAGKKRGYDENRVWEAIEEAQSYVVLDIKDEVLLKIFWDKYGE